MLHQELYMRHYGFDIQIKWFICITKNFICVTMMLVSRNMIHLLHQELYMHHYSVSIHKNVHMLHYELYMLHYGVSIHKNGSYASLGTLYASLQCQYPYKCFICFTKDFICVTRNFICVTMVLVSIKKGGDRLLVQMDMSPLPNTRGLEIGIIIVNLQLL